MKQGDAVRLTLAYFLIAASGKKTEADKRDLKSQPAGTAATPAKLAFRDWVQIARNVATQIGKNRVIAVAAGLTFYAILAIFPGITALVSIYGLFADPASIKDHLAQVAGIIPEGAISVISDQVERIASQGNRTLGFAFVSGLFVALWSANAGMKALFDALNVAYDVEETRSFFRLNAISLLFTVSAIALIFVGLSASVILPWILDHFFFGLAWAATIIRWLSIPAAIIGMLLALAALYRYGPALKKPAWRWITPGSLFATLFLIVSSGAFTYYAAHFGSYNKTYGTLGAIIGFMTWLWIASIVVLVGAEINAETERKATRG